MLNIATCDLVHKGRGKLPFVSELASGDELINLENRQKDGHHNKQNH